jgi:putative oxidoreductase
MGALTDQSSPGHRGNADHFSLAARGGPVRILRGENAMENSSNSIAPLIGRMLISWIFLYSAVGQVTQFSLNASHVAAAGMPFPPLAIVASIVVQFLGGLALLLGFKGRITGWVLFLFLIPTTLVLHNFWGAAARPGQEIQFFKNMGIMGGLLFVGTFGAGAYSVDALLAAKHSSAVDARVPSRSTT